MSATRVKYSIDGVEFASLNVYVSKSAGLLDRPKLKSPTAMSWPEYHGEIVDLKSKRVEAREISLSCFIYAAGKEDFIDKANGFLELFAKEGTQRLMVEVAPAQPLVYEVYCENGVAIDKRWSDSQMAGTFTLKLKEPDPVKRVVRFEATAVKKELAVTITTAKAVTIYWGDGEKNEDVYGTNVMARHEYTDEGVYYVIVAGVIEDVEEFAATGTIIWNKI